MFRICKTLKFDAAHHLTGPDAGKCANIHGHSFKLEVVLKAEDIAYINGWVTNFSDVKDIVDKLINREFDHKDLNKSLVNCVRFTTAECMAEYIFKTLKGHFWEAGIILEKVRLWETDTSWAEYSED